MKEDNKKEAKSLCTINILDEIVQHDLALIQLHQSKLYN